VLFIQYGWMPQKKSTVLEMPMSTEWTILKKKGGAGNFLKHPSFHDHDSLHSRVDSAGIIIGAGLVKFVAPGLRRCEHA